MKFPDLKRKNAFTLIELLLAMVLGAIVLLFAYRFFLQQERKFVAEKLKGDVQSLSRISFFLVGRDIRRAGSDVNLVVPRAISGVDQRWGLENTTPHTIRIKADLNGDDDIDDKDEDITYEYVDSDNDGVKDQLKRKCSVAGESVNIDNVEDFRLSYKLAGSDAFIDDASLNPFLIRKVKLAMTVNAGRLDPDTKKPVKETFETVIKLRNFQQ